MISFVDNTGQAEKACPFFKVADFISAVEPAALN